MARLFRRAAFLGVIAVMIAMRASGHSDDAETVWREAVAEWKTNSAEWKAALDECDSGEPAPPPFDGTCAGHDGVVFPSSSIRGMLVGAAGAGMACCDGEAYDIHCFDYCKCPDITTVCYIGDCATNSTILDGGKTLQCGISGDLDSLGIRSDRNEFIDIPNFCAHYKRVKAEDQQFRYPDDTWSARRAGQFELLLNPDGASDTGISIIHMAHIPRTNRALTWSRHAPPRYPVHAGMEGSVSAIFNFADGTYESKPMRKYPFCSGQSHLPDGSIVVMGGEAMDMPWGQAWTTENGWANETSYVEEGRYSIRIFNATTLEWSVVGRTDAPHWYPTQQTLFDGRVVNIGGFNSTTGPVQQAAEVFTPATGHVRNLKSIPFTEYAEDANLYPGVEALPVSGAEETDDPHLLLFACNVGEIARVTEGGDIVQVARLPSLPDGVCAQFSSVGTSRLLALDPANGYTPTYVMFGGVHKSALEGLCFCDVPALGTSYRMTVDLAKLQLGELTWETETMPGPRVGGTSVVLPTGDVLILNGGERGLGNDYTGAPTRQAWMYYPDRPSQVRYVKLARSDIPRTYHNVAMLMPDGNVLVAGSEQGDCYSEQNGGPFCGSNYDVEYRAEVFKPPYAFATAEEIPVIADHLVERDVLFGATLTVAFTGPTVVTRASLVHPNSITHGIDMSSRVILCDVQSTGAGSVEVTMPTAASHAANPGWYMLFLVSETTDGAYVEKISSSNSLWVNLHQ